MNPHSYVEALRMPEMSNALKSSDWLLPDGIGVVLASRILSGHIPGRITGNDVFHGLLSRLNELGDRSVFFLGSTEDTLAEIGDRLSRDYPKVKLAGTCSPPFKTTFSDDDCDAMVRAINNANPDVLWVGMTAPKQEIWIRDNIHRLETVKFVGAIGAVFDFYAGKVKRSHPFYQHAGLEWLPRLIREPRRLWRRTFVSAPVFMWHVLKARYACRSYG